MVDIRGFLKSKLDQASDSIATRASNVRGNIQAFTNPETRNDFVRGLVSPIENRIPGGFSGASQRIQESGVLNPLTQFKGFSRAAAPADYGQKTKQLFTPVLGEKNAGRLGYGLQGATQFTPFFGANMLDSNFRQRQQQARPQTESDKTAQTVGRTLYGTALTAPIGGGSLLANTTRNLATPTIAGGVIGAGLSAITGNDIEQGAKQGAFSGFSSAPVLAITNPIISRVVGSVGGGFLTQQLGQRGIAGLGNVLEDEILAKMDGYDTDTQSRVLSFSIAAALQGNKQAYDQATKQLKEIGIPNPTKSLRKIANFIKTNQEPTPTSQNIVRRNYDGKAVGAGELVEVQPNKFVIADNVEFDASGRPVSYLENGEFNRLSRVQINDAQQAAFGGLAGIEPEYDEEGNVIGVGYDPAKGLAGMAVAGGIQSVRNADTLSMRPKDSLVREIDELEPIAQQQLELNRAKAQLAQLEREGLDISAINRLKQIARGKNLAEGDVETFRKRDSKLTEQVIENVREVRGENVSDEDALQIALNLPTKAETVVSTPEELKQLRELKRKAGEVRNAVFNSEIDLPAKEKMLVDNQKIIEQEAQRDFDEWHKAFVKQNNLRTARGQVSRSVDNIAGAIKSETKPGYINQIKSDISTFGKGMTDVYRNFDKVFGKNSQAHKEILEPFDKSKGKMVDDLEFWASELDENIVNKYGIKKGSKESAAIQQYGERNRTKQSLIDEFGEDKAKQIIEADKWFRKSYDKLLFDVNEVRKKIYPNNPDKLIPRRSDYYRHFVDLSDTFSGLRNLFDSPTNIAPGLAGVSARTKPKSKWLSFAQKRLGNKTDEDAVGGFIEYVKAQSYAKNIDQHIDIFRRLRQDIVDATEDQTQPNYAQANNFIEFLDDFANDLSGKTSEYDRALQKMVGRKTMRVVDWINSRTKANMIVGNLSSSVAQWFNLPQGIAEAGLLNSTQGFGRTARDLISETGPIKNSTFIKERFSGDIFDRFDTGVLSNAKKAAVWVTGVGDEVATKLIWNSIHSQAIRNGVDNPIRYADEMTRKLVAGRGVGEVPLLQKSRTFQLIAPFQLEVANIWHVMRDWYGDKAAAKFVTFFVASHFMNRLASEIRGSDVSLDPIQAFKEGFESHQEEDNKRVGVARLGGRLAGEVVSNLPLGQTIAGAYDEFGGGALGAITEGITGEKITREELFGEGDPTRFGGGLLVGKAVQDPLALLVPSYGGKQIQRTLEGIGAFKQGFSESPTGKVRFPISQTPSNLARSALFGQFSTPEARAYFNSDGTVLGEKQSEAFKSMPTGERQQLFDSIQLARLGKREKEKVKEAVLAGNEVEGVNNLDIIKIKRDNDMPLSNDEAVEWYMNELPVNSKVSKSFDEKKLEQEKFSLLSKVEDDKLLTTEQKALIANRLGIESEDYLYYDIAKENNDLKKLYVQDEIQKIASQTRDRGQMLNWLAENRREVNGRSIVTFGILSDLQDQDLITKEEEKLLKNLSFVNGKPVVKTSGRGRSAKGVRVKMGSVPSVRMPKQTLTPKLTNLRSLSSGASEGILQNERTARIGVFA